MISVAQPSLFGDEPSTPARADLERLAARIPTEIRFGTSTWTYDGWSGDVYHRHYNGAQPARRLEEYARYPLFRTVGIDSALYGPPSEDALRDYARALLPGFPCVIKVWERITAKRPAPGRRGPPGGTRNPDFLNADLFKDQILGPYARAFRDHTGVFVFEFQAMRGKGEEGRGKGSWFPSRRPRRTRRRPRSCASAPRRWFARTSPEDRS